MENYALPSKEVYRILREKGLQYLYHANTVATSLTFIKQNALLSRHYVEANNLVQTWQKLQVLMHFFPFKPESMGLRSENSPAKPDLTSGLIRTFVFSTGQRVKQNIDVAASSFCLSKAQDLNPVRPSAVGFRDGIRPHIQF